LSGQRQAHWLSLSCVPIFISGWSAADGNTYIQRKLAALPARIDYRTVDGNALSGFTWTGLTVRLPDLKLAGAPGVIGVSALAVLKMLVSALVTALV